MALSMTLLEMVQLILGDMDSDEVNAISETPESLQVANIIKETYNHIVSKLDFPKQYNLFELTASGDLTLPTIMYKPDNVLSIQWIKYNCQETGDDTTNFREIHFLPLKEFLELTYTYDVGEDNVNLDFLDHEGSNIEFHFYNDIFPQYWTTHDDRTIIFNAYNSDEDATLQKSKTTCFGLMDFDFDLTDDFVPQLDPKHFALLFQEAKAQAFLDLKQIENVKAERRSREQWIRTQRTRSSFPVQTFLDTSTPYYGRK